MDAVMIVDDDPALLELLTDYLGRLGYRVIGVSDGRQAGGIFAEVLPDIVLLDVTMPGLDGWQVLRSLRAASQVPVIMLTARGDEHEVLRGFASGADDYVTKPFSTLELKARVRAQLRRAAAHTSGAHHDVLVTVDDLVIDLVGRTVKRAGVEVHLTPTEWNLLRVFIAHAGQTLTHSQLFSAVWGSAAGDAQQYLRVYVGQLRRKLEVDPVRPRLIRTEPAVGYRFELGE